MDYNSLPAGLEVIFANFPQGVVVQDVTGKVVFTNKKASRVVKLGRGNEYLIFNEHGEELTVKDLPGYRVLETLKEMTALLYFKSLKEDKEFWYLIKAEPIFDKKHKLVGAVSSYQDLSELKHTETSLKFLNKVSDVLSSSILYKTRLKRLIKLLVPTVSDWCSVEVLEENGQVTRLVSSGLVSGQLENEIQLLTKRVVKTGKIFISEKNNLQKPLIVVIPLITRNRTFGTLAFVWTHKKTSKELDVKFLELLADRAALLIDNAHLFNSFQKDLRRKIKIRNKLIEREKTLTLALESGRMGVWDWDIQTNEVNWTNMYPLLGKRRKLIKGEMENLLALVHPKDRYRLQQLIGKSLIEKTVFECEFRLSINNNEQWLLIKGQAQYDSQGKPLRVIGINMDITSDKEGQQKIIENERKFKAVFDNALDAFVITDEKMRIVDINPSGCKLFGRNKRYFLARALKDFVVKENHDELFKRWKTFIKKGSQRGEWNLIVAGGVEKTLEYNATKDFLPQRHLFTFRDVTDRKIEEKRREHFLSIASHELRSPLASIKAFAQMLKRSLNDIDTDKAQAYITKIDTKVDLMAGVISELLDVTRIRQGRLIFFPEIFDFDGFIKELVEDLQMTVTSHKFSIRGKAKCQVLADKNRIAQAVTNLLRNAVKYSPDADKVVLRVTSTNNQVVVSIQDFGIGISKRDQKKVFDLYYRGNNSKTNISGLGVGLYISTEIIRQHGGQIWVESKKGKGSIFYLSIAQHPNKKMMQDGVLV